ncbi:MAG TPA: hypothetical protein VFZ66_11185 [Herpetosiphonaceae bacterium]
MSASKNDNAHTPDITLPSSIAQTMRLVQRTAQIAGWGERIAAHNQPPRSASFGSRLFRRFEPTNSPGIWADSFAQRFAASELEPSNSELKLAPYAPAQRQVSAARQGALPWSSADPFAPAAAPAAAPIARMADTPAADPLLSDLMASGWQVQSPRSAPVQRSTEQPSYSSAPAPQPTGASPQAEPQIRRSTETTPPAATPAIQRSTEAAPPAATPAIQRSTEVAPPAATPAIQRSTETPSPDSAPASLQRQPSGEQPGASTPAAPDAPASESADTSSAAPDASTPTIQTAATRSMTLFRGTPQNPLMRMGLSESAGEADEIPAAPSSAAPSASGELPVVRPARSNDNAAPPVSSPQSAQIARRADAPAATPQPSAQPDTRQDITSTSPADTAQSSSSAAESATQPDVQRAPDAPASSAPSASDSVAADPIQRTPDATPQSTAADPIQRTPDATPQSVTADPIQRTPDTTPQSTAAATPDQPVIARLAPDSADAPAASAAQDHATHVAPGDSGLPEQDSAASSAASIARATADAPPVPIVQRTPGASAAPTLSNTGSGVDRGADGPGAEATSESAPVIRRQSSPSARDRAMNAVLPLAARLLQRYSTGNAQGSSAPMPLLRTYALPGAITLMRATEQSSGSAALPLVTPTEGTASSPPSTSHVAALPLLRRSAIVPALPQAPLQRAAMPGITSAPTGSPAATTPASAPAASAVPALDWSALPLLQRLSLQHTLPAAPATSTSSPPPAAPTSHGIAARVLQRLALDGTPSAAPMPLLRMQTPVTPSAVMHTAAQSIGHGVESGSMVDSETAGEATSELTGFDAAPTIRRSAIMPSLAGQSYRPLPLLRMHTPDAPTMAQTRADSADWSQPLYDPAIGSATPPTSAAVMRSADQPGTAQFLPEMTPAEGTASSPPSTSHVAALPLLRRSPIVPALPQAPLQREAMPGITSGPTGSPAATTPASAPAASAAPALDWSALPLLQRLSLQHALPVAPTPTSSPPPAAPTSHGVAARVLQRLALDATPGAAPMPLLRMQMPHMPAFDSAAETGPASPGDSPTHESTPVLHVAAPSLASALVRRSAILPSVPGFAAPEQEFLPMAADTPEAGAGAFQQPASAVDMGSARPLLQRASLPALLSGQSTMSSLGAPASGYFQRSASPLAPNQAGSESGTLGLPLLQRMLTDRHPGADGEAGLFGGADHTLASADTPDQPSGASRQAPISRTTADLALLKPARPDIQRTPEQGQGGEAEASAAQPSGGSADAAAKGEAGKEAKHDIEKLARQVYARLRHRLLIDRERLGRY